MVCKSSPGFLVTRVLFFYLNEACHLWEQGVATEALDRPLRDWGWPMGPTRLIDEVGVDVTDFIFGEMAHYFPDRFKGSTVCGRSARGGDERPEERRQHRVSTLTPTARGGARIRRWRSSHRR